MKIRRSTESFTHPASSQKGSSHGRRAFTLVEVLIASVAMSLIIFGLCEMYMFSIKQWDQQTSYGTAVSTADVGLEKIEADARYAEAFTTKSAGSNTLYVFTMPANATNGTPSATSISAYDATGTYIPQRVSGNLQYVAGPQVCYYLSNTTGSQTVTGGTVLWRATAPAGSSTFTPDTNWSLVNTSKGRCSGLSNFSISTTGMPANTVLAALSLTSTSGHQSKAYAMTRELFMGCTATSSGLASPTSLTAIAGASSVALSWSSVSGATSYTIYRGTTSGGESATPIASGVTGTTYTDSSVSSGSTYYYYVVAVNSSSTSGHSNEASATVNTAGFVTATPSVPSSGSWYGQEQLAITNTQPMTSLTITIVVQKTTGLTYNAEWNNFWGGYINESYVDNGSTVTYTYTETPGDTQTGGSYYVADSYNLTGTTHVTTGDTYTVQVTAGGVSQTLSGHF